MCEPNKNHILDFKGGDVIEKPNANIYTIRGRANSQTVLLHFKKNATPCQGTRGGHYVAYFKHEKWGEAKKNAQEKKLFFHLHGDQAGTAIKKAALTYSNTSGGNK